MSVFISLRWRILPRKLPGILQKRVLLPLGIVILVIVLLRRTHYAFIKRKTADDETRPLFKFDLQNKPYTSLNDSHCIEQSNGLWDCPDIRTRGKNILRQSQLVAIRMLRVFDALCKKHGLRYWITRGTLLGAARHRGFIPWDTDLDVEMPIEDYVELIKKSVVEELPKGMNLQRGKEESNLASFDSVFRSVSKVNTDQLLSKLAQAIRVPNNPRFRDERSCYKYCIKYGCPPSWPDGIMVDIYPIVVKNNHYVDNFERISMLTKLWRFVLNIFGYNFGYKAFPLKSLTFEGFKVPVSNEWERLMKNTYGSNYMDLPPRDLRRLADDLVPDPWHSCSELDKNGKPKMDE